MQEIKVTTKKKQYEIIDEQIDGLSFLKNNYPAIPTSGVIEINGLQAIILSITSRGIEGLLYFSKDLNNLAYDEFYLEELGKRNVDIIELESYLSGETRRQTQNKFKRMLEAEEEKKEEEEQEKKQGKLNILQEDADGIFMYVKDKKNDTIEKVYVTDFHIKVKKEYRNLDDNNLNSFEIEITSCRVPDYTIIRTFNGCTMNDIKTFKDTINDNFCTFFGGLDTLNKLKQYIFDGLAPVSKTVSYGGLRKIDNKWTYIESNKCFIDEKVSTSYTIEQTTPHIKSSILDYEPITSDELEELKNHLFAFNCPQNVYNLLGYAIATLYKEKLKEHDIRIPHLMVIGEAGSGKTQTLNNILFPLWGLQSAYNANCITKYSFDNLASSNTTAPIVLDEYKPYMMHKWRVDMISDFMRTSYDGLASARGTANPKQRIKELEARTNLVLTGEAGTDETAILERSVMLRFSKRDTLQGDQSEHFNWLCKNKHLLNKLARKLIEDTIITDVELLVSIYKKCLERVPTEIKDDRVRKALAFVNFGIWRLCNIYENYEIKLEPFIDLDVINLVIASSRIEEQGEASKSIVDLTLEAIDDAMPTIERNSISNYRLYQTTNNGTELAINIKLIYDLFTQYVKNFNTGFNPLTQREFTKMLKGDNCFIKYTNVKFRLRNKSEKETEDMIENKANSKAIPPTKQMKAFLLDIDQLKKLDLSNLLLE